MVKDMVNHFATVSNNSLAEYGVVEGQAIYLAGSVLVPNSEEHPFDYRMKFLGAFVIDGHIHVTEEKKMFYIDPDNFVQMSDEEEAELIKTRDEEFAKKQPGEVPSAP